MKTLVNTRWHWVIPAVLVMSILALAADIAPEFEERQGLQSGEFLTSLLGDSRRMFANHFFVKADEYFHSGFYPTMFDNQESFETPHMAEDAGALKGNNQGDETGFMGPPRDIIEEFTRHFEPSHHTHLDEGGAQGKGEAGDDLGGGKAGEVREILPWLLLSAKMDPNRIETYSVTSYWLRSRMGKVDEAEQFLRQGLRANPGNPAILFELGRLYHENRKDDFHAKNVWEAGVRHLDQNTGPKTDQDNFMLEQLTLHLSRLTEDDGDLDSALHWLQRFETVTPNAEITRQQIQDLQRKIELRKAPPGGAAAGKSACLSTPSPQHVHT